MRCVGRYILAIARYRISEGHNPQVVNRINDLLSREVFAALGWRPKHVRDHEGKENWVWSELPESEDERRAVLRIQSEKEFVDATEEIVRVINRRLETEYGLRQRQGQGLLP